MLKAKLPAYLLILILTVCFTFIVPQLYAQQPAFNQSQTPRKAVFDPLSIRVMDSLLMLNDIRSRADHKKPAAYETFATGPLRNLKTPPRESVKAARNSAGMAKSNLSARPGAICYTISGRDFLRQDSLVMYVGDPTLTADGNVIVSGEFADYATLPQIETGGFCMKTDPEGNMIWAKLYDSTADVSYDYVNFFKSLELRNGSILLAGRTTNKVSGNDDFVLCMLDNNGNQVWMKTYESKFWQGFNGSGDFFVLRDLQEDPATGEIYFTGHHWFSTGAITKIHPADGRVLWSHGYDSWNSDYVFGTVINPGELLLFQLENGYYNQSYITAMAINKTNGDTLFTKRISQTGDLYAPRLYGAYSMVKLDNGHFRLSGPTTGFLEFPAYTGTVDLYHAGIIELDNNLDFVKAYGFKNRIESNSYNAKVSLSPDGTGVFTMFNYISGYNGNAHISIFKDDLIYHQRKRLHRNEGMPYEPPSLQLADGGWLNIKLMGDSTLMGIDGSKIDYHRMYSSDTASACLGVQDDATSIWYFDFEPAQRGLDSISKNVFRESRVKKFDTWDFNTTREPSCVIISHCDTLDLKANAVTICPGNTIIVTIQKNKECGSLVPLVYDTSFVDGVTKLTDSTFSFRFEKPGSGYIHASLMGCELRKDSVYVEVLPARYSLQLGNDTVLCVGNTIRLNAGRGFATYRWQDGSADSMYSVTRPGLYHVTAVNGCGSVFSDSIEVSDHPPIPISIGPDRFKCNNDTLKLRATDGFINYKWSANYNISSVSGQEVIINPLVDTVYMVSAEKMPGCFAYDTVRIKVGLSPKIELGTDTSICRDDGIVLDAGPGFSSYSWNTGSDQRMLGIGEPGRFYVKATNAEGCSSSDTLVLLSLYDLPQPDLGPDAVICKGQVSILQTPGQYNSYIWSNGASGSSITVNRPGQYWLSVTDAHGCQGIDTVFIPAVVEPPMAFLGADTTICSYGELLIHPSSSYNEYLWSSGSTASSMLVTQPGIYWLEVEDDNHCKGRDTIDVKQKDCMEGLYVPTAFTPNDDGNNDIFRPLLFGDIRQYRFAVYNRWGEKVFESSTPGEGWNGRRGTAALETAAFAWVCSFQLAGHEPEMRKGTVMLVK